MKKFTTKLLMSIIAVAFAFVALGTSTYAWFSMNTSVTATGMQITAKSDSTYLLISSTENSTVASIRSENEITTALTVASADSKVLPSAHEAVTTTSDAVVTNWYSMNAKSPTASLGDDTTKTALTTYEGYVIHKTVYITLAEGSNNATALKVSATFTTNGASTTAAATFAPVSVLVTTSTGAQELSAQSADATTGIVNGSNSLWATLTATDAAPVKVDIYLYYDGANSLVYTNNVANLDGANVNLTFSVTGTAGN